MKPKSTITIAIAIFVIVSVLHLYRLVQDLNVTFGDYSFPRWASVLGIIIPSFLAFHLFKLRKKY